MKTRAHLLAIFFLLWGSSGGGCEARALQGEKNRIVNGRGMANYGEFPYHAMLLSSGGWGTCGGSLITARHVLTAAHCVYQNSPDQFMVELGSVQVGQGVRHYVSRVAWHRNYYYDGFAHHDIGIVHLSTDVTFTSVIQPIALPPAGYSLPAGSRVIISGYGATYPGGSAANEVNVLYTEAMVDNFCNNYYTNNDVEGFCTYTPQESVCGGDSGGPLVDMSKSTLIGIVSMTKEPCGTGADFFTSVSAYVNEFIAEELQGRSSHSYNGQYPRPIDFPNNNNNYNNNNNNNNNNNHNNHQGYRKPNFSAFDNRNDFSDDSNNNDNDYWDGNNNFYDNGNNNNVYYDSDYDNGNNDAYYVDQDGQYYVLYENRLMHKNSKDEKQMKVQGQ